ncbi:hypothetical protein K470DRAFT_232561, partial [Piedraia hortae CBS 480.64]
MTPQNLLILTDATASMSPFLTALNDALPEIIRMSHLTGSYSSIGVIAYRDYCDGELLEWSGWYDCENSKGREDRPQPAADAGGDYPEALKTGLCAACQALEGVKGDTVMMLFADAPPHL